MTEQFPPQQCAPWIWRLPLPMRGGYLKGVNVYIVQDEDGVTLIDSGLGNDETWDILTAGLEALGIPLRHVSRILLTHAHADHAGLARRIADAAGASIWVHHRDLEFVSHRYAETDQLMQDLRAWLTSHGMSDEEVSELGFSSEQPARPNPRLSGAEIYREGERIQVGPYDFGVTWTPGHTPGHVCFSDEQHGLLFCGDHVLPDVSPNVGMQPGSEVNLLPGYLASLAILAESQIEVALPGHGDPFAIQARARVLLDHQIDRQRQLLEILADGPHTAYELGARVWADARPVAWSAFGRTRRNAINTLVAHLELLREEGRAFRSDAAPYRYELS